ncbi:MAG TPA: branched-chain amino acid ABC transporter permease [Jatrophihabitans sp.]|jgi:branched-chain amino acid transport system permease protein
MFFYIVTLLVLGCINGIMVVGLNLQYGYTGLLNFAFYTYVAIGAYVAGVTTMGKPPSGLGSEAYILKWTLPWPIGLLLGGLAAALLGAIVFSFTVRRLRSDYLAIVTVATAFIVWNGINNYVPLFNGGNGIFGVPYITGNANISTNQYSFLILLVTAVILAAAVWFSRRVFRSPYGRILRAIREDETIVAAFGRSVWRSQLWVFVAGCGLGGLAGGMFVFYIEAWSPTAFLPLESFFLMAALIIGGSGSYWGALLGAFAVIEGLNELSRYVPTFGKPEFAGNIRAIVIGLVLILVLRFRPEGLLPERWLRWYSAKTRKQFSAISSKAG